MVLLSGIVIFVGDDLAFPFSDRQAHEIVHAPNC
jgi:hypothetical protein